MIVIIVVFIHFLCMVSLRVCVCTFCLLHSSQLSRLRQRIYLWFNYPLYIQHILVHTTHAETKITDPFYICYKRKMIDFVCINVRCSTENKRISLCPFQFMRPHTCRVHITIYTIYVLSIPWEMFSLFACVRLSDSIKCRLTASATDPNPYTNNNTSKKEATPTCHPLDNGTQN